MSDQHSGSNDGTSTHDVDLGKRPSSEKMRTADEIQDWLITTLSEQLGIESSKIEVNEAFASLGVDSLQALIICGDLEIWLGVQLSPTLLWDFPTIQILVEHLAHPSSSTGPHSQHEESSDAPKEPIAIIGLACRLPGANNPGEFWNLLCNEIDAITEVPADRWDIDAFYDANPNAEGKINSRYGGFIDNVAMFDAQFFGVSPREASRMDPQQRLLLEVAWEALEDAGQVPSALAGSRTGVFIGIGTIDYGRMQVGNLKTCSNPYVGTGGALSIAANRISYVFNFRGPSIAVDTACSSSLVATHLACQSLWNGESNLALAGGVNAILDPKPSVALSKGGFLSPDGRCRAFDAGANGYVRAEGAGIVALKLLSKAREDGDPIYGVILSSAVNQDGHSNGITAPNQQSQELLLRDAYRRAGVSPAEVQYVETHGTGTALGDPIEVNALSTVLAIDRPKDKLCAIGSVKTNIGHAETAAGMASLIKVALMLKHRAIPASLHFREPNPYIAFDSLPVYVQESLGPWPENHGPAIAGISGFGFGGTNAHVVLSESPSVPENRKPDERAHLLALSARTGDALRTLASDYFAIAEKATPPFRLEDLCYTCDARRGHYDHRLAVTVRSWEELKDRLSAFLRGEANPSLSHRRRVSGRRPKIAFVFSGQGSQREAMGRQLMEQEPVFREKVEQCDELFCNYSGWSLIERLYGDQASSQTSKTEVAQPAIFTVQVALASLLNSWGITPDAVIGHSMGEIAAAHVSGALSLSDAVLAIYHRGRLMQQTAGQGSTAALGLSLSETMELLTGYAGRVSLAAHNGPKSTTISGETEAVDEIVKLLQTKSVFSQKLRVEHAFHSAQMDPLLPELAESLKGLQPGPNVIPFFSTVTTKLIDGKELNGGYWNRNLREPVFFSDTVLAMLEEGYEVFLELSPHSVLAGTISRCVSDAGHDAVAIPSLRQEEEERSAILGSLGVLYTLGLPVNWRALFTEDSRCVELPHHPWQRERFWIETGGTLADSGQEYRVTGGHPLLGRHLEAAQHPGTHFWQGNLSTKLFPYLADHRLQGTSLLPATAYVEMALAASTQILDGASFTLADIEFKKALFLNETDSHPIQTVIYPGVPGEFHFRMYSSASADKAQGSWTLNAIGRIEREDEPNDAIVTVASSPDEIRAACTGEISGSDYYVALQSRGFDYGPAFQGLEHIWYRPGEALGRVRISKSLDVDHGEYRLHPAALDACTQVLGAAANILAGGNEDGLYMPVGFSKVRVLENVERQFWSHVTLREGVEDASGTLWGDVRLLSDTGRLLAEVLGVRCVRLSSTPGREEEQGVGDWLYEIEWQPTVSLEESIESGRVPATWLILSGRDELGAEVGNLLATRGDSCVIVSPGNDFKQISPLEFQIRPDCTEDFRELCKRLTNLRGVVHLWNLDLTGPEEELLHQWEPSIALGCISLLHLVQALVSSNGNGPNRLLLVTRGAQKIGKGAGAISLFQSPAYGLAGVVSSELSNLGCVRVELDPDDHCENAQQILNELLQPEGESQIALRGHTRYLPRLIRYSPRGSDTESSSASRKVLERPGNQPFRLEISAPYVFDNLALVPTPRRNPGIGEVEIQVIAAGLNFRDVLKAIGLYPGLSDGEVKLGDECAGRIVAIGEGVREFHIGDEVIAITHNAFGEFVAVDARLVVLKPSNQSFEEAATIPVAFSTAYHALCHIGKLTQGERILIHAAAGGVGLAAVSIAQSLGAEIFATAGSQEKRDYLKSLGVQHLMDSRSLDWAQEVMRLTNGEGVDVILNSLAGPAIGAGLASLRAFGRFVEIGKMDIYENNQLGLYPFRNNVAFSAIDMEQLFLKRPDLSQSILRGLIERFQRGELKPLPHKIFSVTDSVAAFRYMAQRKNTGKVVISFESIEKAENDSSLTRILPDYTYLVSGGLGGLGLKIAEYLVSAGARNLALIGRSDPTADATEALRLMAEAGANIFIGKGDVADEDQLARVLGQVATNLPAVKGIVHAAGVLDDGILQQLDQERFYRVLRPKVAGAWNLHKMTTDMNLDFFVLFSSVATVFSNPGQGNYVAANAFLDALAHYRRAKGLPALSVNWGPWAEVGMASKLDQQRLAAKGLGSIKPEQGVRTFEMLLSQESPQLAVIPISNARWATWSSAPSISALLSLIVKDLSTKSGPSESTNSAHIDREAILNADAAQRQQLLEEYLRVEGGRVLGLSTSKLDVEQPLNRMGIDSLMAVELKTRIEADLGLDLPILKVLEGASLSQLASFLSDGLGASTA